MNWMKHGDRWKNSVLQLKVIRANYNSSRPYGDPDDKKVSGSGFIIDIENGYVATNAHVVSNAICISGRIPKLGKRDISLELIGICKDKDLALCRINSDDIKLILRGVKPENVKDLNMKFGDNMNLKETDEVMTIGYPLGQENIKYTTGIVAGFESKDPEGMGDMEDAYRRPPTYIQITAAINPGNSGGPLLNTQGEVIGINAAGYLFAQNVGYAIPSRTFLAIYNKLSKNTVVKVPTLALEWNKTNRELMALKTGDERTYGIYVRKIHPDSCVDTVEPGDIIKRLNYKDIFWASKDAFDIKNIEKNQLKSIDIYCYFDRYGDASVGIKTEKGFSKLIERKINFAEIVDMIPIGADLTLEICRDKSWYLVEAKHVYKPSARLHHVYPRLDPVDYEIFAGLCCANLNKIHAEVFDNLVLYDRNDKNRYRKRVVICQIFPDTTASRTQVLTCGDIISTLNNKPIETLDDIRKILREKPSMITIKTTNKSIFMVNTDTVINEDKKAMQNFNIRNHNYLLESKLSPK